ncbi:pleiotropic drug resistance protein 3-like [Dorcoceras hygrometricum]|uniref:Pleiotropic drug resistance protein 3-like n=1 Tax=Dorcoceras hygrometricum TaxID=472368 RepID=A0A2Z7D749_9LAMI|nr:pleiotropic drug resistance protein 3-like [Dorcoceras hygrometricum]
MHELNQQLRASAPAHNSLQNGYRMEELLDRIPTLPQTYQTMAGNDENHRIKSTVNSTRVRKTEVDNRENISLSMGSVNLNNTKRRRKVTRHSLLETGPQTQKLDNPTTGCSTNQKLVPHVASKRCVPTYVNDVAQTQQLVANPLTGFHSANQNDDAHPYFIQSLALAQNNQTQATVELTIVDICSQLVPDATLKTASHQLIKTLPFCPQQTR